MNSVIINHIYKYIGFGLHMERYSLACWQAANQNRGNKAVRNTDDIAGFMNPWTTQSGYPVITINTTNGQVYQKQFLFNNSANSS